MEDSDIDSSLPYLRKISNSEQGVNFSFSLIQSTPPHYTMKGKILLTGRELTHFSIIGGNGFIGSHTAVSLIEGGYEVVIVDNLSNSR